MKSMGVQSQDCGAHEPLFCADCGVDTAPPADLRKKTDWHRSEYYMVHDWLWKLAGMVGMDSGFLCIGCLEHRLGRELRRDDFIDAPVNDPGFFVKDMSRRLLDRLTRCARVGRSK
jgi:hypothetical protein